MLLSQYLLESSFCLLVFYGFYHFCLRKETFFQLNRAYLLATPTLSLIIPWLDISLRQSLENGEITYLYPILDNADQVQFFIGEKLNEPTPAFTLSFGELVLGVYLLGAIFMGLKLFMNLFSIFKLIKNHNGKKLNEETFILEESNIPSSSFFSFIFWNSTESTENQRLILEHEKVHVRQWHSLDVLWMECLVILKWFNPLIYLFRNALRVTHEFIADAYILKEIAPVDEYATALVKEAKKSKRKNAPNVLSHTFHSLIKQRLNKMIQPKSSKWKLGRYCFIFPLALSMMVLFSFNCSDALPGGKQVGELSEYLDDLGDKTVFEVDKKTENFIRWGKADFKTRHFQDDDMSNLNNQVNPQMIQNLFGEDVRLFIRGKERLVTSLMVSFGLEGDLKNCTISSEDSATGAFCFKDLKEKIDSISGFSLALKTADGELCYTNFLFNNQKKLNITEDNSFQEAMVEFSNFTTTVSNIDIRKSIFKEKRAKNYLQWGDKFINLTTAYNPIPEQLPEIIQATSNISLVEFQKLGNEKLTIHFDGVEYLITTFKLDRAAASLYSKNDPSKLKPLNDSKFRDFMSPKNIDDLAEYVRYGYQTLVFTFSFLDQQRGEVESQFSLKFYDTEAANKKEIAEKGLFVNRPIANFQLINQRDRQTIIKMDTTSKKYRWMYENYKKSDEVQVVHIPDFKTITRVVTLADEIVREDEIAASYQLIDNPKDALIYPEFHELLNANVLFSWRDLVGVFDGQVAYLKDFKASQKVEPTITVNGQPYKIKQFELLAVPVDAPAVRFISDSTQRPEIQAYLNDMELRTSLYFSNILIEDDQGKVVLFPLRFAFNLM